MVLAVTVLVLVTVSQPLLGAKGKTDWREYAKTESGATFEADRASELERAAIIRHDSELREPDEQGGVLGEDPGVGSTRVIIDRWSSGNTYQDDSESGIASVIWSILLNIVSYFTRTAGNIMLDIAQLYGDAVDQSKGSTTRLYHSYSYPDKLAQVWTVSLVWTTYFTSRNREWYRHEYASYVNTLGYTRTKTRDYTPDEGGSAIHIDTAPHYSSNTWLQNEAWRRWSLSLPAGLEDWTD